MTCPTCEKPDPAAYKTVAMNCYECPECGWQHEVNGPEVTEYIGTLLARIEELEKMDDTFWITRGFQL